MDLREIGWEGVDWIHLDKDRNQWRALVNAVMNLRVPYKAGNFLTSGVTISTCTFSYFSLCLTVITNGPLEVQHKREYKLCMIS
jgi:hypothetical protein